MRHVCETTKPCTICRKDKPLSAYKGRYKAVCTHCQPIHEGIRSGMLDREVYVGLDYDTTQLSVTHHGYVVLLLEDGRHEKVSLELAKRWVRQGGAYVVSEHVIESLVERATGHQDIRFYVRERDGNVCHYCQSDKGYTVDHITPRWRGGLDTPLNLTCACETCNQLKDRQAKSTFLRKLKKGTFPAKFSSVSWKDYKKAPKTKKCRCCNQSRDKKYFQYGEVVCKRCQKFERPLALGYITQEVLKGIRSGVRRITEGPDYDVLAKDGRFLGRYTPKDARAMAQKGLIHVDERDRELHFLFDESQLKRLHPTLSVDHLLQPTATTVIRPKVYTLYKLYDKTGQFTMNIKPDVASKLERLGLARTLSDRLYLIHDNQRTAASIQDQDLIRTLQLSHEWIAGDRIVLLDDEQQSIGSVNQETATRLWRKGMVEVIEQNRIAIRSEVALSHWVRTVITKETVAVYDASGTFYKNVGRDEALEWVIGKQAILLTCEKIKLTQPIIETVEVRFDLRKLKGSSYRLYSHQGMFIGHIPVQAAQNLVGQKMAEIQGKTDIELLIPLSQARVKEPSLVNMNAHIS